MNYEAFPQYGNSYMLLVSALLVLLIIIIYYFYYSEGLSVPAHRSNTMFGVIPRAFPQTWTQERRTY